MHGGGLHVAQDGTTVSGGIRADAGFTSGGIVHLSGAKADFAESSIAGGIRVSDSMDIVQGGLAVFGTGAWFGGGITVSQVGLRVMDGGATVARAGAAVSGGGRVVSDGVLVRGIGDITGVARIRGGTRLSNAMSIGTGGMQVLGDVGVSVAGGLHAAGTILEVVGGFAVSDGGSRIHGGLDARSQGVRVATGGTRVNAGGLSVARLGTATFLLDVVADGKGSTGMRDASGATGLLISDTGEVRVSGGAAVGGGLAISDFLSARAGIRINGGGMTSTGRLLVHDGVDIAAGPARVASGADIRGGLTTSSQPLTVAGGATIVGSRGSRVSGGLAVSDSGVRVRSGGATMFGGAVAHAPITVHASHVSGRVALPFASVV